MIPTIIDIFLTSIFGATAIWCYNNIGQHTTDFNTTVITLGYFIAGFVSLFRLCVLWVRVYFRVREGYWINQF